MTDAYGYRCFAWVPVWTENSGWIWFRRYYFWIYRDGQIKRTQFGHKVKL